MFNRAKFLGVVSVLTVLVVACSDNTQSTTDKTTPPANTTTNVSATTSGAAKTTTSATNISSLGVKNASEIKFQTPPPTVFNGFVDIVNNSGAPKNNVSKSGTVTLAGWAIIPEKNQAAEKVIITLPGSNQIIAIANVNTARPDVVKALKSEAYKNSGWNASFKGNSLPTGKVILKAWAYDPTTKTATQIRNIHELTVSQ